MRQRTRTTGLDRRSRGPARRLATLRIFSVLGIFIAACAVATQAAETAARSPVTAVEKPVPVPVPKPPVPTTVTPPAKAAPAGRTAKATSAPVDEKTVGATVADKGSDSGLPLPRFVSLGSEKVNARTGPGVRYPISWQFVRRGLPVEIVAEYDYWRKIRDQEGTEGWVHKNLLSGRRTALIIGGTHTLYRRAEADAEPIMQAEAGVQVRLLSCRGDWCQVDATGRKAYLARRYLWGVYSNETIE